MTATLNPGPQRRFRVEANPGDHVMAELERRLKRRGAGEGSKNKENSKLDQSDIVAPEPSNTCRSHLLSSTSSQSSEDSLSSTLPLEPPSSSEPLPSPSRTMGSVGVVRMIRLSLKSDTYTGGLGHVTSPSKGKYSRTTVLTSHEECEKEEVDPNKAEEEATLPHQTPPLSLGTRHSRERPKMIEEVPEQEPEAVPTDDSETHTMTTLSNSTPVYSPPSPAKQQIVSSTQQEQQQLQQPKGHPNPEGGSLVVPKGPSGVRELAKVFSSCSKEDGTTLRTPPTLSSPLKSVPESSTERHGSKEARKGSTEMDKQRAKQEVSCCCGNSREATEQEDSVTKKAEEKANMLTDAQKPGGCTSNLPAAQENCDRQTEGKEEKTESGGGEREGGEGEGGGGEGGGGGSGKPKAVPFYMNVFDDDSILKSLPSRVPSTSMSTKDPKKPVPTPRKSISEGSLKTSHRGPSQPNSGSQHPTKAESKKEAMLELVSEVVSVPFLEESSNHSDGDSPHSHHPQISRTTSGNPTNIRRRTTPKAQKELRKGVVTDGSITNKPDVEQYISMSPTKNLLLLSSSAAAEHRKRSKTVAAPQTQAGYNSRNRTESTDSTQSGYYLKILPNMISLANPQQMTPLQSTSFSTHPETAADEYIPMSSPRKHTSEPTVKFREPKLLKQKTSPLLLPSPPPASKTSPTTKEHQFQRSQGSIFAREMLSFVTNRDSVQSSKYSTAGHPFTSRVTPTQRDSSGDTPTYIQWHEYVDIDPEEIGMRAQRIAPTPPKVPPRPDMMPPLVTTREARTKKQPYKSLRSFLPHNRDSIPPPPPPKTDSLLREQGALPPLSSADADPYLTPIPVLKGRSHTTIESSTPPSRSRAKDIIKALKREAITEDLCGSTPPYALSPQHSPMKLQRTGVFHVRRRGTQLHPEDGETSCLERSYSDPNLLDRLGNVESAIKLSPSVTASLESLSFDIKVGNSSFLTLSEEGFDSSSSEERDRSETVLIFDTPLPSRKRSEIPKLREHRGAVQNKINRDSLAMILRHRDVITRKLHPLEKNQPQLPSCENEEKRGKETLIRSLGGILLEIDSLLCSNPEYTEDDLVTAIEKELKLKLRRENENHQSDASQAPAPQESTSEAVEITEEDVQSVVNIVTAYAKQEEEEEEEEKEKEEEEEKKVRRPLVAMKPRQSTLRRSFSDAALLDRSPSLPHHKHNSSGGKGRTVRFRKLPLFAREQDKKHVELEEEEEDEVEEEKKNRQEMEDEEEEEEEEEGRGKFTQSLAPTRQLHRLQRVNAKRRPSAAADEIISTHNTFTSGAGIVSHLGAELRSTDSGVVIEVPKGAIPRGKRQRLWFDVLQTVYQEEDEQATPSDLVRLSSSEQLRMESLLRGKKEGTVQLSPLVVVGPGDVALHRPIKLFLPHCVPSSNTSWNLKVQGRAQNSEADEWVTLTHSFSSVVPRLHKRHHYFKGTSYQLLPEHVVIHTRQLGSFRLIGRPVSRSGRNVAKKMTCLVYSEGGLPSKERPLRVKVVFLNALLDQVEAVNQALISTGFVCVKRDIPVLCYGDHKDMEVTLLSGREGKRPIDTKIIPFGRIWRTKKVGQACALFHLFPSHLGLGAGRQFTLRIQQSMAHHSHEVDIILP